MDGERVVGIMLVVRFDRDFNVEVLELDDGGEDSDGGEEVYDVGKVLFVESFLESMLFVGLSYK